jgi:hypothetical protein
MLRSEKWIACNDEADRRVVSKACDDALDICVIRRRSGDQFNPVRQGGELQWLLRKVKGVSVRIQQIRSARDARNDVLEDLDPLAGQRRLEVGEARDVAARMRQAGNETAADRLGNGYEHDRDRAGLALERDDDRRGMPDNDARLQADKLLGKRLHPLEIGRGPAIVDPHIFAVGPPKLL